MDIVYIVGRGSKHDNIELRMSLRSICKYGTGIGKVIVAGYPCNWLSDEVVKIPVEDKYGRKHLNITACLKEVVARGAVEGEFLYSSDDHFYVKPTDFDHYPYYAKAQELRNDANTRSRCYGYHLSLMHTRQLLEKYHLPIVNFEEHCNTHMHTQVFKDFSQLVDESLLLPRGAAPTSLIMNAWLSTPYAPRPIVKRGDIKIRLVTSPVDMRTMIGDLDCFSIGDSAFATESLMDFFRTEYPEKCRYEK